MAFKLYVGTSRKYSLHDISSATDIDYRTIESYSQGKTAPELPYLLRISAILGSHFLNNVLGIIGLQVEGTEDEILEETADILEGLAERMRAKKLHGGLN